VTDMQPTTRHARHLLRRSYSAVARLKNPPNGHLTLKESINVVQKREARKKEEREAMLADVAAHLPTFHRTLLEHSYKNGELRRSTTNIFQINIGKLCNLTCHHCHVESSPTKVLENMDLKTVERCIEVLKNSGDYIDTVDITGGAPELNPHFRYLVTEARKLGKTVIDRCNLVIFFEEGMKDLPQFLADNQVQVIASLPCYLEENVDNQRGKGVYKDSVEAIKMLNKLGYGKPEHPQLQLHLVYNPATGPTVIPGNQELLQQDYKAYLKKNFDLEFNNLLTISNMPIKRFADDLYRQGKFVEYMQLLVEKFNINTVDSLMCCNTLNIQWDGSLYDCDFNGALELPIEDKLTIWDINSIQQLENRKITTGKHCYGCTAGHGSSCGGALT
jgi:radical SAM/Cys-rich protein